jgi:hypothetical protein
MELPPDSEPLPLPVGAFDVTEQRAEGVFLGWTCRTRNWLTRKVSCHSIWPDRTTSSRFASMTDALNFLRGPQGMTALIEEA